MTNNELTNEEKRSLTEENRLREEARIGRLQNEIDTLEIEISFLGRTLARERREIVQLQEINAAKSAEIGIVETARNAACKQNSAMASTMLSLRADIHRLTDRVHELTAENSKLSLAIENASKATVPVKLKERNPRKRSSRKRSPKKPLEVTK